MVDVNASSQSLVMSLDPTFGDLVAELRRNASDDTAFAQRVALVCCFLVKSDSASVEAIRGVFGLA